MAKSSTGVAGTVGHDARVLEALQLGACRVDLEEAEGADLAAVLGDGAVAADARRAAVGVEPDGAPPASSTAGR